MNKSPRIRVGFHDSAVSRVTRMYAETLQNARRAGAACVRVSLSGPEDRPTVTIADDGANIAARWKAPPGTTRCLSSSLTHRTPRPQLPLWRGSRQGFFVFGHKLSDTALEFESPAPDHIVCCAFMSECNVCR